MITPVVVDQKSWLFADTVAGAQASAEVRYLGIEADDAPEMAEQTEQ
ncbi:hypothetical protein QF001_002799 [Paraburkholderia youngii]